MLLGCHGNLPKTPHQYESVLKRGAGESGLSEDDIDHFIECVVAKPAKSRPAQVPQASWTLANLLFEGDVFTQRNEFVEGELALRGEEKPRGLKPNSWPAFCGPTKVVP